MRNATDKNKNTICLDLYLDSVQHEIKAILETWALDWEEYGDEIAGMSLEEYLHYKGIRKNARIAAKRDAKDLQALCGIYRVIRAQHIAFLREALRIRMIDKDHDVAA